MDSRTNKNIHLFYFYRFISRFYMYLPILIIIFLQFHLNYIEMSIAIATHSIAILLFKIPLKSIIIKVGSLKRVVFVGELTKCIGIILLSFGQSGTLLIYIAQVIGGIGFSLTTSVESSLLYSIIKEGKQEKDYRRIEAKSQAFSFVSVFFAGIGGSLLAVNGVQLPILISVCTTFLSASVILLVKVQYDSESHGSGNGELSRDIKRVSHALYYYACNRGAIIAVFVFIMPLFLTQVYQLNNILFGIYLGLFSLTGYIAGSYIEKLIQLTKNLWFYVPLFFILAVVILLSGNFYILFLAPVLLGFSAILVRPLSLSYINAHIESDRSLVMSRGEQYFGFFNAVLTLLFGILIFYTNIMVGTICFLAVVLLALLLIAKYAERYRKSENIDVHS